MRETLLQVGLTKVFRRQDHRKGKKAVNEKSQRHRGVPLVNRRDEERQVAGEGRVKNK
jgi:hypothetical protein